MRVATAFQRFAASSSGLPRSSTRLAERLSPCAVPVASTRRPTATSPQRPSMKTVAADVITTCVPTVNLSVGHAPLNPATGPFASRDADAAGGLPPGWFCGVELLSADGAVSESPLPPHAASADMLSATSSCEKVGGVTGSLQEKCLRSPIVE